MAYTRRNTCNDKQWLTKKCLLQEENTASDMDSVFIAVAETLHIHQRSHSVLVHFSADFLSWHGIHSLVAKPHQQIN